MTLDKPCACCGGTGRQPDGVAMSGARLVLTAVEELSRREERYALCAMCIGVGQGIASIVERV